jgi:hypothetical protein
MKVLFLGEVDLKLAVQLLRLIRAVNWSASGFLTC